MQKKNFIHYECMEKKKPHLKQTPLINIKITAAESQDVHEFSGSKTMNSNLFLLYSACPG